MLRRPRVEGYRFRGVRAAVVLLVGMGVGLSSSQCITENGRCGKHQIQSDSDALACECAPGYVLDEDRVHCISCGAHAKAEGNNCVCEPGYARGSGAATCEKVEGSVPGSACSDDEPCTDPNPYCVQADGAGYCTQRGCVRNDDCPERWLCAANGGEKYCRKPPKGLGDDCESNAGCADKEARYCEAFMLHECMVNACALDPSVCPSRFACCDLTKVLGESLCLPTALLANGACPGGGKLVMP